MFKYEIAYTITEEFIGDEGYYLLYNPRTNKSFGDLRIKTVENDFFSEHLFLWFKYILKIAILLKNNNKVYLNYIESAIIWLEFSYDNSYIEIKEVHCYDNDNRRLLQTKLKGDVEIIQVIYSLNDKLTLQEYIINLINVTREYILEVKSINVREVVQLKELEEYIIEILGIYNI